MVMIEEMLTVAGSLCVSALRCCLEMTSHMKACSFSVYVDVYFHVNGILA